MRKTHKAVLHTVTRNSIAVCVTLEALEQLRGKMHLSLAYTETLSDVVYDHYDVWAIV